jgi:hypothetical protein
VLAPARSAFCSKVQAVRTAAAYSRTVLYIVCTHWSRSGAVAASTLRAAARSCAQLQIVVYAAANGSRQLERTVGCSTLRVAR